MHFAPSASSRATEFKIPERELSLHVGELALWIYIQEWDMRSCGAELRSLLLSRCQAEASGDPRMPEPPARISRPLS
ncbi:hypothetical protein EVAR_53536_1 [Eumeta japonica]|uniref:Uncharacterized protein n=1 Tax=Eumeta variegata TaxID=151549 RepID=A0A4C1Y7S4_EUMVA|nr:hypothetical protein EVAR_53536_1 [Eumeta japonica]